VFEAAVDGFGGAVAGVGAVEVGQDVGGASGQCPPECGDLVERGGDAGADAGDELFHDGSSFGLVGFAVGGDHGLVDGPGGFGFAVGVGGEQRVEACGLSGGEEVGAGVQDPPGAVEGVAGAAAVAVEVLPGAAPALVERVAAEADHVERGPSPSPRRVVLRWWRS